MQIKSGTVIACKYKEFENDKKAAHHPFLVINCDNGQLEILVCTDNSHKLEFPNSVTIDYSKCGLIKPTRVICSKYTAVSESDVTTVIGNVTSEDFDRILNQLASNGKPEYFENWRQDMTDAYSKDLLYCSECGSIAYLKTFIDRMPDGSVWRRGDCLVCTNCGKRFPIDDSFD